MHDRPAKPRAVIFDWDSTLVATHTIVIDAYSEVFAALRVPFDPDVDYIPGIPSREFIPMVAATHDLVVAPEDCERGQEQYRAAYFARLHGNTSTIARGAIELLNALRQSAVGVAIASSAFRVAELARSLNIADHVDAIVDRGDVAQGKPEPDLFLEAARRLKVPPPRCCGIEDAPAGIMSIVRAKMCPIGVRAQVGAEVLGKAGAYVTFISLDVLSPPRIEAVFRDWQIEERRTRLREQQRHAPRRKTAVPQPPEDPDRDPNDPMTNDVGSTAARTRERPHWLKPSAKPLVSRQRASLRLWRASRSLKK